MLIKKLKTSFKKEFSAHKIAYLILVTLFLINFFLRVYRIDQVLGFYFDQGRDALTIRQILQGSLVLIGPTTGIAGLFRGPFYYYFLAPGYFLGGGDPAVASIYQSFFVLLGYGIIFYLLRSYFSFRVALVALFLLTF